MITHLWPRRCKSKSSGDWGVKYWEQLNEGGEVRTHRHTGESYKSPFKSVDQLLKDHGAFGVYEVFDHHQTPPAPIHRWPRRAVRPNPGIKYLEQATPESRLMVIPKHGEPFRSAYLTMDEMLSDANAKAVETFDHHDKYPRYLEERIDRGGFKRRKYTSADHAVWADGEFPSYNLCGLTCSTPSGGRYATIDAALASGNFIETDANGVALDGSDAPKADDPSLMGTVTMLRNEREKLQRRVAELEAKLKNSEELEARRLTACSCAAIMDVASSHESNKSIKQGNDAWSPAFDDVMRRTGECIKLRKEVADRDATIVSQKNHIDAYRKEAGSFSSCLARADAEVVRLRKERDEWQRKYEDLIACTASAPARWEQVSAQYEKLRYALNDIVKFARRNPTETDIDIVHRIFGERDTLNQTVQKMRDALK